MRARKRTFGGGLLAAAVVAGAVVATGATPALAADHSSAQDALASAVVATTPQGAEQALPSPARSRGLDTVTASNLFFDAIGDNQTLAPDLQQMLPFTTDDGRYSVGITLNTNLLVPGDLVTTFVNTDGNAATGEPTFGGADVAVAIVGQSGTDAVATLRWNGSAWQSAYFPSLISFTSGATDEVWSISAAELGIAPGTATTLAFGASYDGIYASYYDFAPDGGSAFPFTAGAGAPPPPAAPPAAPPAVAPPAPAPVAPAAPKSASITAPATYPLVLRSMSLAKSPTTLRTSISWTKGTGRVTWSLRLRSTVNGRNVTKLVRGAGQAGTRTINRTVQIPASWKGSVVSARLSVTNQGATVTRTGSIRF